MGAVYHDGLDAGLALGRAVAQQVLVRATLDGVDETAARRYRVDRSADPALVTSGFLGRWWTDDSSA
ncbi:MAG TPA: hypothetical protein VLK82_28855 [Candidatus Tectomicrobia bacterium]|nr:hypothetical protein [Candidatus Tectomicrobia bacterium]